MSIAPKLLADVLEKQERPTLSPPEVELVVAALRAYDPPFAAQDSPSTKEQS